MDRGKNPFGRRGYGGHLLRSRYLLFGEPAGDAVGVMRLGNGDIPNGANQQVPVIKWIIDGQMAIDLLNVQMWRCKRSLGR